MTALDTSRLLEHISVPFLPTIGVTHPLAVAKALDALLNFSHDGDFLPFDREKRWGGTKQERLLKSHIFQDEAQTIIPTFQATPDKLIKLYVYGKHAARPQQAAPQEKLSRIFPQSKFQCILPGATGDITSGSIVFLAEGNCLTQHCPETLGISLLKAEPDSPVIASMSQLAKNDPDNNGFHFLHQRLSQGQVDGDIFASIENNAITGAIGPLQTLKDAAGQLTRYPAYFGVLQSKRREHLGVALWNKAALWAAERHVEYIILQARAGSAAECFYRHIGLKELGRISRSPVSGPQ